MADMRRVYEAFLAADAAGDTDTAQTLADYIRQQTASSEELAAAIRPDYTMGEAFSKGVKRGFKQMGSTLGDILPAMAAKGLGFEDYAKRQMEEAAATQEEIAREMPAQYTSYKQIEGLGSAAGYAAETIGEQVANILTALIPGAGAEAVAGRAALSGVTKAALAQASERGLAGEAAEQFAAQAAKAAAPEILARKQVAQAVGTYLGSYAQTAPEIFQNIYEQTGDMDAGAAAMFGAVNAALDSVLPSRIWRKLTGPAKLGVVETLLAKSGMDRGMLRKTASEILTSIGAEGLTEGVQEAISITAENFVDENKDIFDSMDWNRIIESSIRGAIAGGAFGAVGGAAEGARERGEIREEEARAAAEESEKQESIRLAAESAAASGDIEALQAAQEQMSLEGIEPPIATGLVPELGQPTKEEAKADAKEAAKQQRMFTEEGALTPAVEKAAEKDAKRVEAEASRQEKIRVEEEKQRVARIKKLLNAKQLKLPLGSPVPESEEVKAAKARIEEAKAAGQTDLFDTTPPAPVVEAAPTVPDTVITDATLKGFGIGHTASIRKNKTLEGKDIANPKEVVDIKNVLETYAQNRSAPIRTKIEEFLKRPEFGVLEAADVSRDTGPIAGAGEPELQGPEPTIRKRGTGASRTAGPFREAVETTGSPAAGVAVGEEERDGSLATEPQRAGEVTAKPTAAPLPNVIRPPEGPPTKDRLSQTAVKALELGVIDDDVYDAVVQELKSPAFDVPKIQRMLRGEERPKKSRRKLNAPKYKGKPLSDAASALVAASDVPAGLDYLISNASPDVARVLRKIKSLGLKTKIGLGPVEDDASGSYDPASDTITLDPETGLTEHAITHELVHAAISHVLNNPNHPLTREFAKFFAQVQGYLGNAYGAQNLQEFAAELVSNPEFQTTLKAITAPRSKNMFQRVMQAIAEFFGFGGNSLDAGIKFVSDILDVSGDAEPSYAQKLFLGNGGIQGVREIGGSMPALTKEAAEKARNVLSNYTQGGSFAKAVFGLLRLDNLYDIYRSELPSIKKLLDAIEQKMGYHDRELRASKRKVNEFLKVQKKHKDAFARMEKMAIDVRLAGVDILNPKFKITPENQAEHTRFKAMFNSLPKEVQDVYRTIRNDYDSKFLEYKKFLMDSAGDDSSLRDRIKAEFEARTMVKGYVPFMRFGDFWLEYPDPKTGERVVEAFESVRERDLAIKNNLAGVPADSIITYKNLRDISYSPANVPPNTFVGQILSNMRKKGASQEMLNDVYQSYLLLFPGESIVKQMVKADKVAGMSGDLVRGYDTLMMRWANKFSNSIYNPEITAAINEIREQGKQAKNAGATAAAENIMAQRDFFMSPTNSTLVRAATSFSYFEFIAGNISSALVNLTSLPIMVWPMLGGAYGLEKARQAMATASKLAMGDWGKNSRYSDLYNTLDAHAQLQHSTATDVLEASDSVPAKILKGLAIPFSATERYNRAVTAIAAYDLALRDGINGKKVTREEAIAHAVKTVKDLHTSGMAATAPRWMQQGLGRVFLTFKSYVWNTAFVMARAWHQAFKGESEAVRKAAKKQLIATYAMATAFAGVKGLPFYGAASVLGNMIAALAGDDDEPFDFNEAVNDITGDLFYKGVFNEVTNLEIANRTGIATDLIFRDDPRGVAEKGYALSALQQMFGPAGAYAVNAERAIRTWNDGHTERAIEALAPSWVRNAFKGSRFMLEGATTLKGDPIDTDINAWNMVMQTIGFAPADLSLTYEKLQTAKGYERELLQRRTKLLNLYEMAQVSGDPDLKAEFQERRAAYNSNVPQKLKVTDSTLERSMRARLTAERDLIHGVRFNRNLLPQIKEKFFEEDEE
jgi:hypothetical protein